MLFLLNNGVEIIICLLSLLYQMISKELIIVIKPGKLNIDCLIMYPKVSVSS